MKTNLTIAMSIYALSALCQANWITAPGTLNTGAASNITIGTNNNFPMQFYTNKFQRFKIFAGNSTVNDGFAVFGNNIPAAYVPNNRIVSYVKGNSGANLFQFTCDNFSFDGMSIGNNPSSGFAYISQSELQPFSFFLPNSAEGVNFYEWLRIQNNATAPSGNSTDGYLGLNQPSPVFHIDGVTPKFSGGELFAGFNPEDVPKSKMGFCNGAAGNSVFLPIFFGNVDSTQTGPGMQTLAAIKGNQDLAANTAAVQRFVVGREWYFNLQGIAKIDTLANRNAFAWQNAGIVDMLMNAKGRLRVGYNINPSAAIGNRLVITSAPNDPGLGLVSTLGGSSGLRFSNLTASTPTLTNPGKGVLGVDSTGNVIYIAGSGNADNGLSTSGTTANIHFGQNVGATGDPGALLNNREVPMKNFNISFKDGNAPIIGQNKVYFGYIDQSILYWSNPKITSTNMDNDLRRTSGLFSTVYNVFRFSSPFGTNPIYFGNVGGPYKLGVLAYGVDTSDGGRAIGVSGFGYTNGGTTQAIAIGVSGKAYSDNNTGTIVGVYANSGGNAVNTYGGQFFGGGATNSYGVYATSYPLATISYAGYFNGDVFVNGGATSGTGYLIASDKRIKKDIQPISKATESLMKLKPSTYNMDPQFVPQLNVDKDHLQYGLIAQELETVFPELVKEVWVAPRQDEEGKELYPAKQIKSVNYIGLIPVLIKGMQEQQQTIDQQAHATDSILQKMTAQQKQIDELRSLITSCCASNATRDNSTSQTSIELSDKNVVVLNQNVPNPFAESTYITYNIPTSFKFAQIIFSTTDGKVIKAVDIRETGAGKINVFASDLSSGLYTYSLIIDGRVVDTKKMVKQE